MRKGFTCKRLVWVLGLLAFLMPDRLKAQFPEDGKRYAIFTTYHYNDPIGESGARDITFALDNGCNAVEIGVRWADVYPTATSSPNWAKTDRLVALALSKNAKIALRLITLRANYASFWSEDQTMRDARGATLFSGGDSHVRFGHAPTVSKAQDFIRAVAQRYQYLNQQGHLLFMSVVATPYLELEYFFVNFPRNGGSIYETVYDFNEGTISDFQQWVLRKHGSLATINQKWGSSYRSVSDIRPSYPNAAGKLPFQWAQGLDWYAFRHAQLKAYADVCIQTIKGVDPTIRFVNQHGSVWDALSDARGTYGFKNLAENADGVKINDALDYPHQLSMDILRSNLRSNQWFFNELDGSVFLSERVDRSVEQVEMMKSCFKYGAKGFTLANFIVGANEGYLKSILDRMRAERVLDPPVVTNITPVAAVSYKLSQIVQSNVHEIGLTGQWQALRGTNGNPVRVILDEDILGGTTSNPNLPPTVESSIPDQQAQVGQAFTYTIPANTFKDADGQIVTVSVSGLPGSLSYNATNRVISGTPSAVGTNDITVTATDDKGATISDYFSLAVRQAASPLRLLDPILTCSSGRFEFRSTDGDGTSIEYQLDGISNWSTNTTLTLADNYRNGSAVVVKARQSSNVVSLTYTTTCSSTNRPPVVVNLLPDRGLAINQFVSIAIPASTFSDPDGRIASISVSGAPTGMTYDAAAQTLSGAINVASSWQVTVTATDDKGATVSDVFTLSTNGQIKPLRLLTPSLDCYTGRFEFKTADGDGTTIEYIMDRVFDWTTQSVHTVSETVRMNDMHFRARQSGVIYYGFYLPDCATANKLPVVANAIPAQNLTQYRNVTFTIPTNTFSDPDGTIRSIALTNVPEGLDYNATTRTLTGAPTGTGSWTVSATATDDRGGTVVTTFIITVVRDVKPLRLLAPTLACNTGRMEFRTADGNGTTIQYSIDGVLNWTTRNTYTLAAPLRYDTKLTIRARQSNGDDVAITFETSCPRTNLPPVVANHIANQVLTVNQPASIAIPANTFTDPDGVIASISMTGLPVGLSYDAAKRTVSGTPTLIGSSAVIVKATDNAGASVSDTFQITVRSAPRFTATVALIDVEAKSVRAVNEGDLIDIQKLPATVNLSCVPKTTSGSVLMELSGPTRRSVYANTGPYQLFPTGQGFKPAVGSYQLKISVYAGANGTGTVQGTTTIRFDIVTTNEPGSIGLKTSE